MKLTARIISSFFIGYIVFCILNLCFGNSGLFAMKRLQEIKSSLETNILLIEDNHRALTNEFEGLRSSTEQIALEARSIGYFKENEGVIIAEGYSIRKRAYPLGKVVEIDLEKESKKPLFRGISMGAVLCSLIVVFITAKSDGNIKKRRPQRA
jgi:hypothetical protein